MTRARPNQRSILVRARALDDGSRGSSARGRCGRACGQVPQGAPRLGCVCRGKGDPRRSVAFIEGQRMTGGPPGDDVGREHAAATGSTRSRHAADGRRRPGRRTGDPVDIRPAETVRVGISSSPASVDSASSVLHVPDAREDHRGPEQRGESVGVIRPPAPCLREVLQARQCHQSLTTTLADHRREVGDGGDVGHLVERQHDRWSRRGHTRRSSALRA